MKYHNRLSAGANNIEIALSDTEVAKLFVGIPALILAQKGAYQLFLSRVGSKIFEKYLETEMAEFREFFLNR